MKSIEKRICILIILPALILLCAIAVINKVKADGKEWAYSSYNRDLYSSGMLHNLQIFDRSGLLLAGIYDDRIEYTDNIKLRVSTLHIIGDTEKNIAGGALYSYNDVVQDYSFQYGISGMLDGQVTLKLSISGELNCEAMQLFDGRKGAAAICDYTTGEILCLYTSGGFDPYDSSDNGEKEYFNRFISGVYTPGSVFKLVLAAAAIEIYGDIDTLYYECSEECYIGGTHIACTGNHHMLNLKQALACSCNCYFAQLAVELGGETIWSYASQYGLLNETYIDSVASSVGSYDYLQMDTAALAWSGVGQATDLVNPAGVMRFICAIANGGKAQNMTLLYGNQTDCVQLINEGTAEKLKELMRNNVISEYTDERFSGMTLCAKSGTAEVGEGLQPHSWFVGFSADENYPYAFVVIVENGGWGLSTSGSISYSLMSKLMCQ